MSQARLQSTKKTVHVGEVKTRDVQPTLIRSSPFLFLEIGKRKKSHTEHNIQGPHVHVPSRQYVTIIRKTLQILGRMFQYRITILFDNYRSSLPAGKPTRLTTHKRCAITAESDPMSDANRTLYLGAIVSNICQSNGHANAAIRFIGWMCRMIIHQSRCTFRVLMIYANQRLSTHLGKSKPQCEAFKPR